MTSWPLFWKYLPVLQCLCSMASTWRRMAGFPRVRSELVLLPVPPLLTRYLLPFLLLIVLFNKFLNYTLLIVNLMCFSCTFFAIFEQVVDDVLKRLFQFKREEVLAVLWESCWVSGTSDSNPLIILVLHSGQPYFIGEISPDLACSTLFLQKLAYEAKPAVCHTSKIKGLIHVTSSCVAASGLETPSWWTFTPNIIGDFCTTLF